MSTSALGGPPVESSLWSALRHYWLLVVACVFAGVVLAHMSLVLQGRAYESRLTVLIYPLEGNPYSPVGQGDDLTNLQTEALVVKSDPVVSSALSSEDLEDAGLEVDDVVRDVTVSIPANTQTIEIVYRNSDQNLASALTPALGQAYLQYRLDQRDQVVNEALEATQRRIDVATQQFRKAVAAAESGKNEEVNNGLADSLTAELVALRAQQVETSAASRRAGEALTTPPVSEASGLIPPALRLTLGGLVGLALGTLGALALQRKQAAARRRAKPADTPIAEPSQTYLTDDDLIGDFQWTEYPSHADGR